MCECVCEGEGVFVCVCECVCVSVCVFPLLDSTFVNIYIFRILINMQYQFKHCLQISVETNVSTINSMSSGMETVGLFSTYKSM